MGHVCASVVRRNITGNNRCGKNILKQSHNCEETSRNALKNYSETVFNHKSVWSNNYKENQSRILK